MPLSLYFFLPEATHSIGETIPVQFVWQLPDGDFLRAIFEAEILDLDERMQRYLLRLRKLTAGRQETPTGDMRPAEELSRDDWANAGALAGCRLWLAYEAADGRPLRLRPETLTGEHRFFHRFDDPPG